MHGTETAVAVPQEMCIRDSDEGVKMSVTTDKDGVHQAQIQTNDKGEIDNNSYGTLLDYIPAKI